MRRTHLTLAACLAVFACGTGCAQRPAPTGEPRVEAVPVVRSDADIVLPLDSYLQTDEQTQTVSNAVTIIGRGCMRRFALEWPAAPVSRAPARPRNARRYLILDRDKARVEGYHALDVAQRQRAVRAETAKLTASQAAMNVWAGRGTTRYDGKQVPDGGCAGEAVRQLTADVAPADPGLAQRLQLDSFARTEKDSRVVAAFGEWSACMKQQGFDYRDPYAANNDQRWMSEEISPVEIATAVADVECKIQTNVAGTMLAVEEAYQHRLIDEHAGELDAVKAYVAALVANAARVVAGGGR